MTEWRTLEMGQLGSIVTGGTPPKGSPEWFGDEVDFITPSDIHTERRRVQPSRRLSATGAAALAKKMVPSDSICFVCIASIGKICLTSASAVTNQQINTLIPNALHDARYLYYLLRNERERIAGTAGGAATPIINRSSFSRITLKVPDLATQVRIADVLGSLDDLVENCFRRVHLVEQMAQAVYRQWFVDLRYPGHIEHSILDSPLGPIPDGWVITSFREVAEIRYGQELAKSVMDGGSVPVYGAAKVIGYHSVANVTSPTIVMGCRGTCGQVALTEPRAFVTNNSFTISPTTGVSQLWLLHFLGARGVTEFISGSAQPQITLKAIGALQLRLPGSSEMAAFDRAIQPLSNLAQSLGRQQARLSGIRDLLLPKLVTGEIDVADLDLDALVEAAGA